MVQLRKERKSPPIDSGNGTFKFREFKDILRTEEISPLRLLKRSVESFLEDAWFFMNVIVICSEIVHTGNLLQLNGVKLRFLLPLTVQLALAGCGSKESVTARFALNPVGIPERQLANISAILAQFNERLGSNIASLCSEDCTGVIELVSPREDGIVGLCAPNTYIRSKSRFSMSKGWTRQRKSELRADIKISSDLINEGNHAFLRTIIFHELGHGLLLDHSSNEQDVMFAVVNGEKNFDRYFEQVRAKLQEISQ